MYKYVIKLLRKVGWVQLSYLLTDYYLLTCTAQSLLVAQCLEANIQHSGSVLTKNNSRNDRRVWPVVTSELLASSHIKEKPVLKAWRPICLEYAGENTVQLHAHSTPDLRSYTLITPPSMRWHGQTNVAMYESDRPSLLVASTDFMTSIAEVHICTLVSYLVRVALVLAINPPTERPREAESW